MVRSQSFVILFNINLKAYLPISDELKFNLRLFNINLKAYLPISDELKFQGSIPEFLAHTFSYVRALPVFNIEYSNFLNIHLRKKFF